MLDRRRRPSGEPTAPVDHVAFGDISRDGLGTDTDMDPSQVPALGVPEPPEVADLRRQSADIVRWVAERASDRRRGLRPIVGSAAIAQELARLEPMAAKSIRVLQPQYGYDPEDPGVPLTRLACDRGVEFELVTRPATVATHPLLSSIFPGTLLGPCFLRAVVIDESVALVGGVDDAHGNRVTWFTDASALVDAVTDLWLATVPQCEPILGPGEKPPLTERQLEVAGLICLGEKDDAIARAVSVSLRTAEREVAAVLAALDARSRAEAVLMMRGRRINSAEAVRGPSRRRGR